VSDINSTCCLNWTVVAGEDEDLERSGGLVDQEPRQDMDADSRELEIKDQEPRTDDTENPEANEEIGEDVDLRFDEVDKPKANEDAVEDLELRMDQVADPQQIEDEHEVIGLTADRVEHRHLAEDTVELEPRTNGVADCTEHKWTSYSNNRYRVKVLVIITFGNLTSITRLPLMNFVVSQNSLSPRKLLN